MEEQKTTITDIRIPFSRMVAIILKWMLASIPAILIMYLIMFGIILIFGVGLGGFAALFSGSQSSHQSTSSISDQTLSWDERASQIQIGMTYQEMIDVAGKPRTEAAIFNEKDYSSKGLDLYKYNYGTKWVIFKNNLVYEIR